MGKFRKKPVVIKATQWNGNMAEVIHLVGYDLPTFGPLGQDGSLRISTSKGDMECCLGDWIMRGAKNELWVCEIETFDLYYEAVEE